MSNTISKMLIKPPTPRFLSNRLLHGFLMASSAMGLVAGVAFSQEEPKGEDITSKLTSAAGTWAPFIEKDFPFFSSVLDARNIGGDFPKGNLVPRALVLNLGQNVWAAYDTDLLRIALVWKAEAGKPPVTAESMSSVSYIKATAIAGKGQNDIPKPLGKPFLANDVYEGWKTLAETETKPVFTDPRTPGPTKKEVGKGPLGAPGTGLLGVQFPDHGSVSLVYEVYGTKIMETLRLSEQGGKGFLIRKFELAPHEQTLAVALSAAVKGSAALSKIISSDGRELTVEESGGVRYLLISAAEEPVTVQVEFDTGFPLDSKSPATASGAPWTQPVTTSGILSAEKRLYVMDDIPLPLENPWKRNPRLADIAFLNDKGDAAAVTFDGDIWLISGLTGDLKNVEWRRFASGLHEPMSIVHRKMPGLSEGLFVFDRNGIWRILDHNGDGIADEHELFCNRFGQTAETREYANSMELAPDGSFVISKGGQRGPTLGQDSGKVMRVSPDGKDVESLGWGFRQPFIGVNPKTGLVTASDQQGEYVPATPIYIVQDDEYHGFLADTQPVKKYPAPIADPLTWIPHPVNPSALTQVWGNDTRFGPLDGECILIGFNRPELFHVLFNSRFEKPQGAVVSFSRDLEFAPINGTVNPADGQIYVTGFQNFGTTAPLVSGLARFRYSGNPGTVLKECTPMAEGVLLKFDSPLDESTTVSPSAYNVERWNYRRTEKYGSPHLKLDGKPGSEWMTASSVYLSKDKKSVFIALPDMKAGVMQMRVGWGIKAQSQEQMTNSAYFTPYDLATFEPEKEGFGSIKVDLTPRKAENTVAEKPTLQEGKRLYEMTGCMACHSIDGSGREGKVGPTWKGLYGRERLLVDNSKVKADETYLRESMLNPSAKIPKEFRGVESGMPIYEGILTDSQIESLILFIKSL